MSTGIILFGTLVLAVLTTAFLNKGIDKKFNGTPAVNNRPIIGILALDSSKSQAQYGETFIPSTYVKFLEQAGARVVPIKGGQPEEYYHQMVSYTNGFLITGGVVNFAKSLAGKAAKIMYDRALEINQKGDFYPMWGTCMGFQLLCYLTQGENLLKPTDSDNASWPLNFSKGYKDSRLFGSAPKEILDILSKQPVTQNQHSYSILIKDFETSKLSKFFTKLSTNKDRNGTEFISSAEAKDYPIYGVQWHPEKNNFNWHPNYTINHSADAVKISQYMANFFVGEARKSSHRFPSLQAESDNLIESYKKVYFNDASFFEFFFIDT